MNKETIRIEQLKIGYRNKRSERVVADQINATLFSGELTCLLGVNGVGKSTLLRTLSAFQPPLGGKIYFNGRLLSDYSDKELSQLISMVLTEKLAVKNMSVWELVGLGRSPYTGFWGSLSADDDQIVEESIRLVGIMSLAHRMIQTLSDGERQKVMIAKALAQQTPIVFLDEPTAFLDYPSKVEMMQLLHTLSRTTGKTIFLSTHDLELALQMADKLWLIDKERGVRIGIPEDFSMDGTISDYFTRKGVTFDVQSGLFRVVNPISRTFAVDAPPFQYAMLARALYRNGIEAVPHAAEPVYVSFSEQGGFVFHISDTQSECFSTIEALLCAIKDYGISDSAVLA